MSDLYYWDVFADAWQSQLNGSTLVNNGAGPRLQIGQATSGGDTYKNRFFARFRKPTGMSSSIAAADIVAVTAYYKARGQNGCFGNGGSPKLLLQRSSTTGTAPTANGTNTECTLTGAGTDYGNPATTATDQVGISLSGVANGDVVAIDITAMFKAYWAARGSSDDFTVVGKPANSTLDGEEDNNTARKFAFHSADADGVSIRDGGKAPYILVEVSTAVAPNAPALTSPADASHVTQPGTTRAFGFTYSHPNGDAGTDYNVQIGTSNPPTDAKVDKTVALAMANNTTYNRSVDTVADFTPDEARGTTYYIRVRTKANGLWGSWSSVRSYIVNRLPIATKTRPT